MPWNPYLKQDINSIERVQGRATKLLKCLRDKGYDERLKALNLTSLSVRRVRGDLIQLYKIIHGYDSVSFQNGIPYSNFGYSSRRNVFALKRELVKNSTPRFKFFFNRIGNTWNKLPNEIVTARNINSFKAKLDEWLNSNCHSLSG